MTEDDTIADMARGGGETVAEAAARLAQEKRRPCEERALDRLRELLAWPNWTREEAVKILAGLDPESMWPSDQLSGWFLLPGTADPGSAIGRYSLHKELNDRVERLQGIDLKTMPPAKAIKVALAAGIVIPWAKAEEEGADERSAFRKAQQQRRRDQLAADDKQKLIEGAGRAAFDQIRNAAFAGYRKPRGTINVAALAREVRKGIEAAAKGEPESWPELRTLEKRVNEWLAAANLKNERSADSESATG